MNAVEQRMTALEKANRVRYGMARLKREVGSGQVKVSEAIWREEFPTMPIGDLIRAQHQWGPGRMRRLCQAVGVPETKPLGTLTTRQRDLICELLGEA